MIDVDTFLDASQDFVERRPSRWSLTHNVDMETFNHLARVWVQLGSADQHLEELRALAAIQHEDGGWGDKRDDGRSRGRTSAFSCQMLLRVRRQLDDATIDAAVERGLDFLVERQEPDGRWSDDRWHFLDATSVSVGTMIFAVRESDVRGVKLAERQAALDRGMSFVLSQRHDDGLWYHKPTSSPVEITAHLLQKCVLYAVDPDVIERGCRGLLELQGPDGDWDKANTDSTCDVIRCLMLASEHERGVSLRDEIDEASERAMTWLLGAAENGAVGVRPGRHPSILYTCDVIDTALKYRAHHAERSVLAGFYS